MYFWNAEALAQELKADTLSQPERMKYLLAFMLFFTPLTELLYLYFPTQKTSLAVLSVILNGVMTLGGVIVCYFANRAAQGKNFVERFICLNVPISIRLGVLLGVAVVLVECIKSFFKIPESDSHLYVMNVGDLVFNVFLEGIYFWWMFRYLREIAREDSSAACVQI